MRRPTKKQRACKHASIQRTTYARGGTRLVCTECYVTLVPKYQLDAEIEAKRLLSEGGSEQASLRRAAEAREAALHLRVDELLRERRGERIRLEEVRADSERQGYTIGWLRKLLHAFVDEDPDELPFRLNALERAHRQETAAPLAQAPAVDERRRM